MRREESNVKLIREFFEMEPYGRKVSMAKMKELTADERQELGNLIRETLPD